MRVRTKTTQAQAVHTRIYKSCETAVTCIGKLDFHQQELLMMNVLLWELMQVASSHRSNNNPEFVTIYKYIYSCSCVFSKISDSHLYEASQKLVS